MAQIDTSIYNALIARPKSAADYASDFASVDQARQQREMNALLMQDKQQQFAQQAAVRQDQAGIRNYLSSAGPGTSQDDLIAGLRRLGTPTALTTADQLAASLGKQQIDAANAREKNAGSNKAEWELRVAKADKAIQDIGSLQNRQQALQSMNAHLQAGDIDEAKFAALTATLPQSDDPREFALWQRRMIGGIQSAKDQLSTLMPKVQTVNNGGFQITQAVDPMTGVATETGRVANVMSPEQRDASARGWAGVNLQRERLAFDKDQPRGQVTETADGLMLVDPRSGSARPVVGPNGQPVRGGGGKGTLNDSQSKALLFGSRMREADKVLADLEQKGVTNSGAIKRFAQGAGNILGLGTESAGGALSDLAGTATNFTQSPEQQQVEQAKRDFVNAVLRRESGAAISPKEFANAEQQYFPQPGDKPETIKQKARNRALAIQGMLAEVPEGQRASLSAPRAAAPAAQAASGGAQPSVSNW